MNAIGEGEYVSYERQPAAVQDLVARWWWNYDEGNFEVLSNLLPDDAHLSCRTESGTTDSEDFVRAEFTGRDAVMAWQTDHRIDDAITVVTIARGCPARDVYR